MVICIWRLDVGREAHPNGACEFSGAARVKSYVLGEFWKSKHPKALKPACGVRTEETVPAAMG